MMVMAIDPGVSGAIAVVDYQDARHFNITEVCDLPINETLNGKTTDSVALYDVLIGHNPTRIVVEYPMWVQHDGRAQASTMWRNFGHIEAAVAFAKYDSRLVTPAPAVWKRDMGLTLGRLADRKQKKAHALAVARKLFGVEPYLKRAKDHDRAEALLLSYWGSLTPPPSG